MASTGERNSDVEASSTPSSLDGDFPLDEEMGLVPVPILFDQKLYAVIHSCDGTSLDDQEKQLTDDKILEMGVVSLRQLCKKCKYVRTDNPAPKNLSTSGKAGQMKKRLLTWYHVFRQEQARFDKRPYSVSKEWKPGEDARLMEILSDPNLQVALQYIHQVAPRMVLDGADDSPVVSVFRSVIAVVYNNFDKYKPTYRFPNDPILKHFNPNDKAIPCRTAEAIKLRYSALRSRLTVRYHAATKSGQQEPDNFDEALDLGDPMDQAILYWWRLMEINGDPSIINKFTRLLPGGSGFDTSDPSSINRSLQAASTKLRRCGGAGGSTGDNTASTGGKGKSPTDRIINALNELKSEAMADEEKENAQSKYFLHTDRDRAEKKVEELADEIRNMPDNDYRARKKRKKKIMQYKRARAEYVDLEREVAKVGKTEFDPEIEKDDASFLSSDDDQSM